MKRLPGHVGVEGTVPLRALSLVCTLPNQELFLGQSLVSERNKNVFN